MNMSKLEVKNHFPKYKNKKEMEEKRKQGYLILIRELNHKDNIYYKSK